MGLAKLTIAFSKAGCFYPQKCKQKVKNYEPGNYAGIKLSLRRTLQLKDNIEQILPQRRRDAKKKLLTPAFAGRLVFASGSFFVCLCEAVVAGIKYNPSG